ncbi:MAG: DUF4115 domain-containing protein [Ignavibacteriales bacterium]|nr:DUF4115 domain-containing protein [Ignavibacteriales bacterium]
MFEKLAEELKEAREKAQLSPEQLARIIKIDLKFLYKIESGDLSFLPELYIKAFLRDYSVAVDLNDAAIIKKYQAAKEGRPYEDVRAPEEPVKPSGINVLPPDASTSPEPSPIITPRKIVYGETKPYEQETKRSITDSLTNTHKITILGVLIVAILAASVYFFYFKNETPEIVVEQPLEQVNDENKRFEVPVEQNVATEQGDSINLKIDVLDTCWVQMVVDSSTIVEKALIPPSTFVQKAANSIKINLGNSAGVNLFVNGQAADFPKVKKKSAQFLITREGIKQINPVQ